MTYELPVRKHLVHKAIEPRNLSKKTREVYDSLLRTGQVTWQVKLDGCNCFFVLKDGEAHAFSRTGEPVLSLPHIGEQLLKLGLGNYVVFGEAYSAKLEHSEINGAFRRQSPQPQLDFFMFDGVPLSDFESGHCPVPYYSRYKHLNDSYFLAAPGAEALAGLYLCSSHLTKDDAQKWLDRVSGAHYIWPNDGFIVREVDGEWRAGSGVGGEVVKDKDHLSLDLICTGIVEGKGKFKGKVGSVLCRYKGGVIIMVGGGTLTDVQRKFIFDNPALLVGSVVEVHALAGSSNGLLREPRFHRLRLDKQNGEY